MLQLVRHVLGGGYFACIAARLSQMLRQTLRPKR